MSNQNNKKVSDVSIQEGFTEQNLIDDMKKCLGFIVSAESGSGKSYLGFTMIRETMKAENKTRVIIFSPSTIFSGNSEHVKILS
jgi:hypothetical protein